MPFSVVFISNVLSFLFSAFYSFSMLISQVVDWKSDRAKKNTHGFIKKHWILWEVLIGCLFSFIAWSLKFQANSIRIPRFVPFLGRTSQKTNGANVTNIGRISGKINIMSIEKAEKIKNTHRHRIIQRRLDRALENTV